tara:strand:- start:556 stop:1035 length:480 start_codon:yes stop_codon:yes gene_type:complete
MAATAHLVARNFAYHIEKTSPTAEATARQWRENPRPFVLSDDLSSGTERSFTIRPIRSLRLDAVTDGYARYSDWMFELEIAYTSNRSLVSLTDIMAQDAHDLVKLLRMDSSFTGYSAAQPTTDIGLIDREFEGQEFVLLGETTALLRQAWRVKIKEVEQ